MSDELDGTLLQGEEQARDAQERSFRASQPIAIPGYTLETRLGEGTFGEVWRAVQNATGQVVAVKVLHARNAGEWEPFLREVQRLSAVAEHPNIVTLLDAGLQHQPPYFVMPLLSGSLAAQEKAPPQQVAAWMKETAEALRYTHSKGILHCDLKPANLLLDQEKHVRVADFGQSAQSGERGTFWGTLGTMAPEQAGPPPGHEGPDWPGSSPDVSWDVYGLGATFYRLLTGIYPRLDGIDRSSLTSSLKSYSRNAWEQKLIPVRKLNPKVDRDLAAIVEKCLEPKISKRMQSAGHLLDELERRQKKIPIQSRPSWTYYVVKRWMQRNPVVTILSVSMTAALLATALGSGYYLTQTAVPELTDFGTERPILPPAMVGEPLHKNLQDILRTCDGITDSRPDGAYWSGNFSETYAQIPIPSSQLNTALNYIAERKKLFSLARSARLRQTPYSAPGLQRWSLNHLRHQFGLAIHVCFAQNRPDEALNYLLDCLYVTYPPATNAADVLVARATSGFTLEMFQRDRELYHKASTAAMRFAISALEATTKDRPTVTLLLIADYFQMIEPYKDDPIKPYLDAYYSQLYHEAKESTKFAKWELKEIVQKFKNNPLYASFHPVQGRAIAVFAEPTKEASLWQAALLNEARFAGIRLDLALELYRRKHKRYPDKLEELVPDYLTFLPGDPYRPDHTYLYHNGLVWSVGPNGTDNHQNREGEYQEMLPARVKSFELPDTEDYEIAGSHHPGDLAR